MGQVQVKDGTAQGVAKVRHYESLNEPSRRLYYDQYAQEMYGGSIVQTWLGEAKTRWLYETLGFKGLLELITIRTKWLDDEVLKAKCQQLVILGAGYDTRGFRLDLPDNMTVFEVDQPDVQKKKVQIMERLFKKDEQVASRMESVVNFVPMDFNVDSIDEVLSSNEKYSVEKPTVVTMEGVTQYIPKDSTADTVKKLKKLIPPGSTLLISYVDQNVFDDPSKCGPPKTVGKIVKLAGTTGEPWISSWTKNDFQTFMSELGYKVVSDTTALDHVAQYLEPLGRGLPEGDSLSLERYVVATCV